MQRFGFEVGASPPPFAENERRYGLLDGRTQPAEPELLPEAKAVAEGKGERTRTGQQVSRVRTAFGDWSACMKRAGYDYAGPWQAHDNPEFADRAGSEREIAIWVSVETAYQRTAY